jgi:hypothetical protein
MNNKSIFIGQNRVTQNKDSVTGNYVEREGELFYKITNYDKMNPFFMSIVSSSDQWMFISSNGGLTAGRKNSDNALFPYYTDDIIHTSHHTTGSKTILLVNTQDKNYLWEPFSDYQKNIYNLSHNIYKNIPGNKIIFEEENHDFGLVFSYVWMNSDQFGFVKQSRIFNRADEKINIHIIDGIQNILPYGIYEQFQSQLSTLADGYKKNELIKDVGLGIYSLSSIPTDKAEPSESLKATTIWSKGIEVDTYLLSSRQLDGFKKGKDIIGEAETKGVKGDYFIEGKFSLSTNEMKDWIFVAEINQDIGQIAQTKNLLKSNEILKQVVIDDVEKGTEKLKIMVALSDGLQISGDKLGTSRHFSNVLFNIMRGGIFDNSYTIDRNDFISFVNSTNRALLRKHQEDIYKLDNQISYFELKRRISELNDNELTKLSLEYLPLTFSRRHGDPSRPWNKFSIEIKNEKNKKVLNYEGNWRDLFQNWEALAISFPEYLEGMIAKFLNASTADGYNPYRVNKMGFDWEVPEPDMPWANIGYWGDHQIIYLLKLLEFSTRLNISTLLLRLKDEIYSYANVPYRIKSYNDLLADATNTIDFDAELHDTIIEKEKEIGTDARFLHSEDGKLVQVNLAEKLLVTLLSKLTNFIPEAGIWMNTQRPEWNDANNALVGSGVSMVTLYYLRRYISFCTDLFSNLIEESFSFSNEISSLLKEIHNILDYSKKNLERSITDNVRKEILDGLGIAGEKYRNKIYDSGFSGNKEVVTAKYLIEFFHIVRDFLDHSISHNKRNDGLYHSYNLISIDEKEIEITNLYEMLEGQVAVLSSGFLSTKEVINILGVLRKSKLYRVDQDSYILYPERTLPLFINKNTVKADQIGSSKILQKLIEIGNKEIISIDVNGDYHFNGEIQNARILKSKLNMLRAEEIIDIDEAEIELVCNIYEAVFNHKSFTGRSGTFYKYEGLGSIYWHMVSKLVVAVQENFYWALDQNADKKDLIKLKDFYYDIKKGLGIHKSPDEYGAFPTDPYSHTPVFSGVQQPGMTGQVKEDIICRFGELGLRIIEGQIKICPDLLNLDEILDTGSEFKYFDIFNKEKTLFIKPNSLAFTFCQVPFIYELSNIDEISVYMNGNTNINFEEMRLSPELSNSIFKRDGKVNKVVVSIRTNFD